MEKRLRRIQNRKFSKRWLLKARSADLIATKWVVFLVKDPTSATSTDELTKREKDARKFADSPDGGFQISLKDVPSENYDLEFGVLDSDGDCDCQNEHVAIDKDVVNLGIIELIQDI